MKDNKFKLISIIRVTFEYLQSIIFVMHGYVLIILKWLKNKY